MNKIFNRKATVTREIVTEPIKGTEFSYFVDTRLTRFSDGKLSSEMKNGITSNSNLAQAEDFDDINLRCSCTKMYDNYGFVVAISNDDMDRVMRAEAHITDVIESTVDSEWKDMKEKKLILFNGGSYEISDLNHNLIATPIHFDYTDGNVDNSKYDLELLLDHLKSDDHVVNKDALNISRIPCYNADEFSYLTIEFYYLLSDKDYENLVVSTNHKTWDIRDYILKNYIHIDNFKINQEED